MRRALIAVLLFVVLASVARADTIIVGPGPGYGFNTIQAGIDAAGEGDTVIVAEGTYYENIHFYETNITLRSTEPNDSTVVEQTIIDGGGLGSVVTFPYRKNANTKLAGFTITRGSSGAGGGIAGYGTKATISHCIIRDNYGGGIVGSLGTIIRCVISENTGGYGRAGGLQYCHGLITHCIISDNTARAGGSGLSECNGQITNCVISGNSSSSYGAGVWDCGGVISNSIISNNFSGEGGSGGIHYSDRCSPTISNCLITGNTGDRGGGIYCGWRISLTITNCTIAGNTARKWGGGIFSGEENNLIVINSILWGNTAPRGDQIVVYGWEGSITISYSDIQGGREAIGASPLRINWGPGNIDPDPLFALDTDYHIMPKSPCIDAGDPNYTAGPNETDLDGNPRTLDGDGDGNNVVDMGAYEYNPSSPFIAFSVDDFYFVQDWPKREPQTLLIRNCGGQPLHWEIIEDCNWLKVAPANGVSISEIDEVTITVDPNGLAPGLYSYTFEVQDPNASNSPVSINITMPVGEILRVLDEFATIQAAIDDANDYDIVLVADGNYTGEGNRDIDFLGKAITVKSENGPNNCVIDCNGIYYEPHRGFYFHSGETANSVVDGFTITNGYTSWYLDGGAIYCIESSPTIRNCIISGNEARRGGGIFYGYKSSWPLPQDYYIVSATVTNCTISNNIGGGIYCDAKGMLTITNCTISGNTSYLLEGEWGYEGGGIYCSGSSATITNCTITGNSTKSHYGGGGICYDGPCLTISNCVISDNIAEESALPEGGGGGIRSFGRTTIANCNISGNSSRSLWGGGGGGIYYRGRTTITNCNISGNSTNEGGGIYSDGGSTTLTNCTMTGNLADGGGGGIFSADRFVLMVTNCILWGNSDPEIRGYPGVGVVSYSNIEGGWPGQGNINADPCFVDPGYWADANDPNIIVEPNDPNAVWIEGDYHLLPTSPCIDTGDPNFIPEPNETDLDGRPRVADGDEDGVAIVDMGAYEYMPPIPAEVDITPDTLNLASQGRWITCHIRLGEDYNITDIDPNTVFLDDIVSADSLQINNNVAIAKFSRSEVQDILEAGDVELTVTGELVDGTVFEGTDTIRVIDKGKKE